jgi:hypothetical protein
MVAQSPVVAIKLKSDWSARHRDELHHALAESCWNAAAMAGDRLLIAGKRISTSPKLSALGDGGTPAISCGTIGHVAPMISWCCL